MTKCWKTGPKRERRGKKVRKRRGRRGARIEVKMREKGLDLVIESVRGLGTGVGGIAAEEGEIEVEKVGTAETGAERRGRGAETETGEGPVGIVRRRDIVQGRGGAVEVVIEAGDLLEVQLAVLACRPLKTIFAQCVD